MVVVGRGDNEAWGRTQIRYSLLLRIIIASVKTIQSAIVPIQFLLLLLSCRALSTHRLEFPLQDSSRSRPDATITVCCKVCMAKHVLGSLAQLVVEIYELPKPTLAVVFARALLVA